MATWCKLNRDKVHANRLFSATQEELDDSVGLLYLFSEEVAHNEKTLKDAYGEGILITHKFSAAWPYDFMLVSSATIANNRAVCQHYCRSA